VNNWRSNPKLVECFDSCVAMFHGMKQAASPSIYKVIRERRLALGLTQQQLAEAVGYSDGQTVSVAERGGVGPARRVAATLDRLEAERATQAAAG
jgi:DNA-binding XRE family transcriptional regulator